MPVIAMNVKQAVATGDKHPVKHFMAEKSVQVAGTFSATMRIQGSNDGANWADLTGDLTSAGITAITTPLAFMRVDTTAYTSGTPVVTLCGYGARYEP